MDAVEEGLWERTGGGEGIFRYLSIDYILGRMESGSGVTVVSFWFGSWDSVVAKEILALPG